MNIIRSFIAAIVTYFKLKCAKENVPKLAKEIAIGTVAMIDNVADHTDEQLKTQMHDKLVAELKERNVQLPESITSKLTSKVFDKLVAPAINNPIFQKVEKVVDAVVPEKNDT